MVHLCHSVTNTGRTVRNVWAQTETGIGSIRREYCRSPWSARFQVGGAVWMTGL